MKKLLTIVFVIVLFALTGCGGSASVNLSECTIANAAKLAQKYDANSLPSACKAKIQSEVNAVNSQMQQSADKAQQDLNALAQMK
jgi:entry exclusion lipoprotein TrbK